MLIKVWTLIFISFLFLFTSCSDTDADGHSGEHFEPVEWFFMSNDSIYLHIDKGVINNGYNSSFDLNVNDSLEFEIIFKNEEGEFISTDEEEIYLNWEIFNSQIVNININNQNINKFNFNIKANSKGSTEVTFIVMHGDHKDIISPNIPIIIE